MVIFYKFLYFLASNAQLEQDEFPNEIMDQESAEESSSTEEDTEESGILFYSQKSS